MMVKKMKEKVLKIQRAQRGLGGRDVLVVIGTGRTCVCL